MYPNPVENEFPGEKSLGCGHCNATHLVGVDLVLVLAGEEARHRDGDGVRNDRDEDRVRDETRPQREVRYLWDRHPDMREVNYFINHE